MTHPETTLVELPFIQQLQSLGWDYLPGDTQVPDFTERASFRQVLLSGRLRAALRRINLDENGQPWLDEARISEAVNRLERLGQPHLIEANQAATELLLKGTQVEGPGGKHVTIHYLDFVYPERNDFLVINQFRVDPPWVAPGQGYIVPDKVVLVTDRTKLEYQLIETSCSCSPRGAARWMMLIRVWNCCARRGCGRSSSWR